MDDKEWMLLVRDGNKEAYEVLIKKHMSQAKAFALKYVHDTYAAEDIVQESFADIYVQRFNYDRQYSFTTYLYAIIKNKAMNYLKKNRELPMSSFEEQTETPLLEQKLINDVTPETEYFRKTELRELMSALGVSCILTVIYSLGSFYLGLKAKNGYYALGILIVLLGIMKMISTAAPTSTYMYFWSRYNPLDMALKAGTWFLYSAAHFSPSGYEGATAVLWIVVCAAGCICGIRSVERRRE